MNIAPRPTPVAPRSIYAAVFLVSMSVLIFEISAVRLFSVLFRYHYVFVVVSFSILGLGLGALLARWRSDADVLVSALLGSTLTQVGGISFILFSGALTWFSPLSIAAGFLIQPFVLAGWFLAGIFMQKPKESGKLYAADLSGAATGCVAGVVLLNFFGPWSAILINALFPLLAASLVAFVSPKSAFLVEKHVKFSIKFIWLFGLSYLFMVRGPLDPLRQLKISPDSTTTKPLLYKLNTEKDQWRILGWHWDAFTRTDVVQGPDPNALYIYTDGDTPTQMLKAGSIRTSREGLEEMIGYVPFFVWPTREGETKRMLCIGAGGGLDVQIGRAAGVKEIEAVDINRALPKLLEQFKDFHGDVYGKAGTELIIAEGRNFLARDQRQFDVIYFALTQTATASGTGMALAESYIHTIESFADGLRHLTPDGVIVCVFQEESSLLRGIVTTKFAVERVVGTERRKTAGAPDRIPRSSRIQIKDDWRPDLHIAAISEPTTELNPYNHLLLVKRSPLTEIDLEGIQRTAKAFGREIQFLPGMALPSVERRDLNLWPPHDDNPFFLDLSFGVPPPILGLLAIASAVTVALIIFSFLQNSKSNVSLLPSPRSTHSSSISYLVCAIGIGFMIVQNVAVQRFILFLGYPTLALAVVIFAMLVGGALGSVLAQRWADKGEWQRLVTMAALVVPLIVLLNYAAPAITRALLASSLAARVIVVIFWMIPTGAMMGMFFPTALRLSEPRNVPLLWAINGTASVVGAAATLSIAKLINFTFALNVAMICYFIALAMLARLVHPFRAGTLAPPSQ